jgi:hypothetical protein
MLPLRNTLYSQSLSRLPDRRPLFSRNSRSFNGGIRVLFKHRNVGHYPERNPALPVLSQHPVLFSKRVSKRSSPDCIVESHDMGYTGVPTTFAHRICTSSPGRLSCVYRNPCWTFTSLCPARNHLLHLVLETVIRLESERPRTLIRPRWEAGCLASSIHNLPKVSYNSVPELALSACGVR